MATPGDGTDFGLTADLRTISLTKKALDSRCVEITNSASLTPEGRGT